MPRALCAVMTVLGMLAASASAQQSSPSMASPSNVAETPLPRLATLGGPQAESASAVSPTSINSAPPESSYTGSYTTLPRPASDPISVPRPGGPLLSEPTELERLPRVGHPWFDNLSLFIGLDGYKEPADLGINSNFGYRAAVNWGLPLFESAGIGLQVGTAINYSQNAMRFLKYIDGTVDHSESFTTVGLFQRFSDGLRWGLVYDFRFDDYYDRTGTGQWRAQLSTELNKDNEIGFWATVRDHGDSASIGRLKFSVEPISQWNVFWRHVWKDEIVTRFWVGLASYHNRVTLFLPEEPRINHPFTFGADIYVPLTDSLALFGETHFITPNDTGTVTATMGIAWYPGSARGTARSRFAPLLPLANNSTFALDVR